MFQTNKLHTIILHTKQIFVCNMIVCNLFVSCVILVVCNMIVCNLHPNLIWQKYKGCKFRISISYRKYEKIDILNLHPLYFCQMSSISDGRPLKRMLRLCILRSSMNFMDPASSVKLGGPKSKKPRFSTENEGLGYTSRCVQIESKCCYSYFSRQICQY